MPIDDAIVNDEYGRIYHLGVTLSGDGSAQLGHDQIFSSPEARDDIRSILTERDASPLAPQPEVTVLEGHAGLVLSVAWSPDGGRLASASDDGMVRVWDAATGATLMSWKGTQVGC